MTNGVAAPTTAADSTPSKVLTGRMPDITAAQLVGIAGAVLAVAVSFGATISREQQEAILALTGVIIAVLFGADAHVRTRRGQAETLRHAADQHAATVANVLEQHQVVATAALNANQPAPPLVFPPALGISDR